MGVYAGSRQLLILEGRVSLLVILIPAEVNDLGGDFFRPLEISVQYLLTNF